MNQADHNISGARPDLGNQPHKAAKDIGSPLSSGGAGYKFEIDVQTSFAVLLLAGSFAPCMPGMSIREIQLQGRHVGYHTDDLIVIVANEDGSNQHKLLAQAKSTVKFTKSDKECRDVIEGAWKDFKNTTIFNPGRDAIVVITGPLTTTDTQHVRPILESARASKDAVDYFTKSKKAKFWSNKKREKLEVIRWHLDNANKAPVSDEETWEFLCHLHLLGYDLDIKSGVTQALLHAIIRAHTQKDARDILRHIGEEVATVNKHAGVLTRDGFPEELRSLFGKPIARQMPHALAETLAPAEADTIRSSSIPDQYAKELTLAMLLGSWSDRVAGDIAATERLSGEK